MFNKVSSHVNQLIKTQFKRPTTAPLESVEPAEDLTTVCLLERRCVGINCHKDCSGNGLKKKCLALRKNHNGSGSGICVECYSDNQCTTAGKLKCDNSFINIVNGTGNGDLPSFTCMGGSTTVEPYMQLKEAHEVIFKPMHSNEQKITNIQTSGASIAELFSDTR